MRRIVCEDCKKAYDYDKEEFCPRCGAFNPPVKTWGTDSEGNVVRVDGVNEQNHAGSFVHREVHKEKNVRKAAGLDWDRKAQAKPRVQPPRQKPKQAPRPPQRFQDEKKQLPDRVRMLLWLLAIILLFNLILPLLFALF